MMAIPWNQPKMQALSPTVQGGFGGLQGSPSGYTAGAAGQTAQGLQSMPSTGMLGGTYGTGGSFKDMAPTGLSGGIQKTGGLGGGSGRQDYWGAARDLGMAGLSAILPGASVAARGIGHAMDGGLGLGSFFDNKPGQSGLLGGLLNDLTTNATTGLGLTTLFDNKPGAAGILGTPIEAANTLTGLGSAFDGKPGETGLIGFISSLLGLNQANAGTGDAYMGKDKTGGAIPSYGGKLGMKDPGVGVTGGKGGLTGGLEMGTTGAAAKGGKTGGLTGGSTSGGGKGSTSTTTTGGKGSSGGTIATGTGGKGGSTKDDKKTKKS